MNEKIMYILIVIVLAIISFCGGIWFNSGSTERLEKTIAELTERNNTLSTRINDLVTASGRDAEASRTLAAGITSLNTRLTEQIKRSRAIADRAQRINFLAGVLDKGISELITLVEDLQERAYNSGGSSNN